MPQNEDHDVLDDSFYDQIIHIILDLRRTLNKKQLWLSICGSPGSGKSTLAGKLANILNADGSNKCVLLPADGYHYSKAELNRMDDPVTAFARRGITINL